MPKILVVDDSAIDRTRAGRLLEKQEGLQVAYAVDGRSALDETRIRVPDLIVTDLQMPEMNGLELVEAIKREAPSIPVILMTARGSEDIAAEALSRGAAGYVPKSRLGDQLNETVSRILAAADHDRMQSRLMHSLEECRCRFRLRNDRRLVEPLVAELQSMLRCMRLEDESERLRTGIALKQAILIAQTHGNFEVPLNSDLTDADVNALLEQRAADATMAARTLRIDSEITPETAIFTIRHEGPGIDVISLPVNLEAAAAETGWLGGFVFLPRALDEVHFEDEGREIVLVKRAACASVDEELEFAVLD